MNNNPSLEQLKYNRKLQAMTEISEQAHQEVYFGDSKYIFYLGQEPLQPRCLNRPKLHRPNTTSQGMSRRGKKNTDHLPRVPLSKCQAVKEEGLQITPVKKNSQQERVSIQDKKQKQKVNRNSSQPKSPIKDMDLKIQNISEGPLPLIKQNKSSQNRQAGEDRNLGKNFQEQVEVEEQLKQSSIDHQGIKNLFGPHHALYKIREDYLTTDTGIVGNKKVTVPQQARTENNESDSLKQRSLQLPSQICRQANKIEYSFQTDRAPIVSYLKNSDTKKIYLLLVKEKCSTEKFVDRQFCKEDIQAINNEKIHWCYINPEPSLKLFEPPHAHRCEDSNRTPLIWVSFLQCVYRSQPDIITRLFQPPINNIFSVWLFVNGVYEPVYVDGNFPLNSQLDHFYCSGESMWLPILLKCICKIYNTYEMSTLSKIEPKEVYRMLTGLSIGSMGSPDFENPEFISKFHSKRVKMPEVLMIADNFAYILSQDKKTKQFIVHDPCNEIKRPMHSLASGPKQLYFLPPSCHWFIYPLQAYTSTLTKFQIECQRKTDLLIAAKSSPSSQFQEKRVYIYECQQNGDRCKTKLMLRMEISFTIESAFRLSRGKYKFFLEDGEKKIHDLFSNNSQAKKWEKSEGSSTMMTLLASHEVKMGEGEVLQRNGRFAQDSSNVYQNCSGVSRKQ